MILATELHWTQAQVDATDPDLVDEVLAYLRAGHDVERRANEAQRRKAGK